MNSNKMPNNNSISFKTGILLACNAVGISFMQYGIDDDKIDHPSDGDGFNDHGTQDQFISSDFLNFLKELFGKSFDMKFSYQEVAFRQKRIVLLISDYRIMNIRKDTFGRDIDCVVRFKLLGQLRFNFDFFRTRFDTDVLIFNHDGTILLIDPEFIKVVRIIGKVDQHDYIDFPVRFRRGSKIPELDENYKLPCVMRKNDLIRYLCI
jgi:hypothetical protein